MITLIIQLYSRLGTENPSRRRRGMEHAYCDKQCHNTPTPQLNKMLNTVQHSQLGLELGPLDTEC